MEPRYARGFGQSGCDPACFLDSCVTDRNVVPPSAEQLDVNAIRGMAIALVFDATERTALVERAIHDRPAPSTQQATKDRQPPCAKVDVNGRSLGCDREEHACQQ